MSLSRWKREGRGSGPANVRDGRFEIMSTASNWGVWDRHEAKWVGIGFPTMREAREWLDESVP